MSSCTHIDWNDHFAEREDVAVSDPLLDTLESGLSHTISIYQSGIKEGVDITALFDELLPDQPFILYEDTAGTFCPPCDPPFDNCIAQPLFRCQPFNNHASNSDAVLVDDRFV